MNMMSLLEVRKVWEYKSVNTLEFSQNEMTLFVIIEFDNKRYSLARYFSAGEGWLASIDCQGSFKKCVEKMSQMMKVLV